MFMIKMDSCSRSVWASVCVCVYLIPDAMPLSIPTSWITGNCPSFCCKTTKPWQDYFYFPLSGLFTSSRWKDVSLFSIKCHERSFNKQLLGEIITFFKPGDSYMAQKSAMWSRWCMKRSAETAVWSCCCHGNVTFLCDFNFFNDSVHFINIMVLGFGLGIMSQDASKCLWDH